MGNTPVALSCVRPHPCLFFFVSQALKVLESRADSLPSFPCNHPYAASNPFIQTPYQVFGICQLEVVYPPSNYLVESDFPRLNSHPVTAVSYTHLLVDALPETIRH